MRAQDGQLFTNISATTAAFHLIGGTYGLACIATGFGTVTLQTLAPDGSTWVNALTAFSANGVASVPLPEGSYRFAVATATAVYVNIVRIPND